MSATDEQSHLARHGASRLSSVNVESYNLEIEDEEGFVGDKANRDAFLALIAASEALANGDGEEVDPEEWSKKKADALLGKSDNRRRAVVHTAIEEFAQRLAAVYRRFKRAKGWKDIETLVIGGGLRASDVGELAIHRAQLILRAQDEAIAVRPVTHDPQEAGLIGSLHLAPPWIFEAYDSILAVDIGGTNIRCGIVDHELKKAADLSKARMGKVARWKHREDEPSRADAVTRLGEMLEELIDGAKKGKLAPFIGVACPGIINEDGSIERGGQNLPGNWESSRFNLAREITRMIPTIGDHETVIVMHNDAVVQGLSERPFLRDVERWAALTIGTGLGNAAFTNREPGGKE